MCALAGIEVRRSAWKNLMFTGGLGFGKSRVAAAVVRLHRELGLGLLSYGNVIDLAAADLAAAASRETGDLAGDAVTRPAVTCWLPARHDPHHPGWQGRSHPHLRCRGQGRHRARRGRTRPRLRQRVPRRPAAGRRGRQPGLPDRGHLPATGPGHPQDHHRSRHPRAPAARARPMARSVPVAGDAAAPTGTSWQRVLLTETTDLTETTGCRRQSAHEAAGSHPVRGQRLCRAGTTARSARMLLFMGRFRHLRLGFELQGFVKVAGGIHPGERHVKSSSRSARWGSWAQRRVSSV